MTHLELYLACQTQRFASSPAVKADPHSITSEMPISERSVMQINRSRPYFINQTQPFIELRLWPALDKRDAELREDEADLSVEKL